jgi:endonuclease-3
MRSYPGNLPSALKSKGERIRLNTLALSKIGWIISKMDLEARKRDAVVFRAEEATKSSPFKILVFTMLSARTKDETTLRVVDRLFKKAKTPKQVIALGARELERLLFGVGFFRVKAANLLGMCEILEKSGGKVPDSLEGLLELPGVGRKTANIVLARAFGKDALGVDVHVHRISNRLGIVKTKRPEETEAGLTAKVPKRLLSSLNRAFVAYGQTICLPRNPRCAICALRKRKICWRVGLSRSLTSLARDPGHE